MLLNGRNGRLVIERLALTLHRNAEAHNIGNNICHIVLVAKYKKYLAMFQIFSNFANVSDDLSSS